MPLEVVPQEEIEAMEEETIFPFETGQGWDNPKQESQRWKFLESSYFGNGGYADGSYLIPHRREDLIAFNVRKAKARFINDFRAIINGHVTPIFRGNPTRQWNETISQQEEDALQSFFLDCDGGGTPYHSFIKKTARAARTYGSAFVLQDRAPVQNVMTRADLADRNNLPFLFLITPDRIVEVVMNERGQVVYIKWITYAEDPKTINNPTGAFTAVVGNSTNTNSQKITVIWTPQSLTREIEGDVVESVPNELGYVPVFALYPEGNDDPVLEPMPMGIEYSLAQIQHRIYNLASLIDEIADSQAYSILVVPGDDRNFTLGVGNALTGISETGNMPGYIAPDAAQLNSLRELLRNMVEEMYRTGVMPHLRTFAESAESKMLNSERTYEVLVDFREQIQHLDKRLISTFADYMGFDAGYEVSYPQKFGISNLEADVEVFNTLDNATTPAPPLLIAEIVKRIKTSVFAGWTDEQQSDFDAIIADHYETIAEMEPVEPIEDEEPEVEDEVEQRRRES